MPASWEQAFDELKTFIDKNPSLEIGSKIICISSDVRPEFYRLFDRVRTALINDFFSEPLQKGYRLSRIWQETSRAVTESLKLKSIQMDPNTDWFLRDPKDGVMRLLFDPLFDVLRGKETQETFEKNACRALADGFTRFLHEGYQMWVVLSLLRLLAVDKVYYVKPAEIDVDLSAHLEQAAVAGIEEKVPEPTETSEISFQHSLKYSFFVPNIIVHSTTLDLYLAFAHDFVYSESKWKARSLPGERTWFQLVDINGEFGGGNLWPDLAIYTSSQPKNLAVAADCYSVAQPDIIVECKTEKEWYETQGLELVKRHFNVLQPKRGTFILCLDDVPEAALQELAPPPEPEPAMEGTIGEKGAEIETPAVTGSVSSPASNESEAPSPDLHLLGVGYDTGKLQPIIEALTPSQAARGEPPAGTVQP